MPAINPVKLEELTAHSTGKLIKKAEKAAHEVKTPQRKAVSVETLRAYSGIVEKKMYADSTNVAKELGLSTKEFSEAIQKVAGLNEEGITLINKTLSRNRITEKQIKEYYINKYNGYNATELVELGEIGGPEEIVRNFLSDIQKHSMIASNPVFEPYNLTLNETSQIAEILRNGATFNLSKKQTGTIDYEAIKEVLNNKNSKLYTTLGKDEIFTEQGQNKVIPARNTLLELQDNLFGHASLDSVINDAIDVKKLDFKINGAEKYFLYRGQLRHTGKIPNINNNMILELIKSNMLTLDIIKSPEFKRLMNNNPEIKELLNQKSLTYKNPNLFVNGEKIEQNQTFDTISEKLLTQGIDSLNSNEIHILTDSLKNVYSALIEKNKKLSVIKNPTAEQLKQLANSDTNKLIKELEPKSKKIYEIVQCIKEDVIKTTGGKIEKSTNKYIKDGITVEDHFFMRMIDRDLANVTENSSGNILDAGEIVKRAINAAKRDANNAEIKGVQGHGLKVITNNKDNKLLIESIMQ